MAAKKTAESGLLSPPRAQASRKTKAISSTEPSAKPESKAKSSKPARQTPPKRERRVKFVHQTYDPQAPIASVRPHPDNPNKGDSTQLAESIDENGFVGTILVQASTGYIIAGNHRWLFLKSRGETTAPITRADVDDATALRILLADNATAEHGKRDPSALEALLAKITGGDPRKLKGTGYAGTSTAADMMERIKAGQQKAEPADDATPFDDDGGEFSGQDEHDDQDPEDSEARSRPSKSKETARIPLPIVLTNAEKRDWDGWKAIVGKKNDGVCFQALMRVYHRAQDDGLLEQLRAEPGE